MAIFQPSREAFLECLQAELRARRAFIGKTNKDLAASLDRSPSMISGWLSGKGSPPRITWLYDLAVAMDVSFAALVTRAEKKAREKTMGGGVNVAPEHAPAILDRIAAAREEQRLIAEAEEVEYVDG